MFTPISVQYVLKPCRICAQYIRAPPPVELRSDGVNAELSGDWWGSWNPSTHIYSHPSNPKFKADWATYAAPTYDTQQRLARGVVSARDVSVLGCNNLPECSHMWRTIGPETECAARYATNLHDEFPDKELRSIALEGGRLIRHYGFLYPALMGVQESEIRFLTPRLEYARENRASLPSHYPAAVGILHQWVRAEYSKGVGETPRILGLPRNTKKPADSALNA